MATIMQELDKKLGNEQESMTIMEALGGAGGMTIADCVADMDLPSGEKSSTTNSVNTSESE